MPRYPELDLLRTLAIVMMVIYHTAFDLSWFYNWDIDVFSGGWKALQIITATLFIGLVGVTASISQDPSWYRALKRFVRIGSAAMLVTIVTYIIDPNTFVLFGVLHMIAISALLLPLFMRFKSWTIVIGIVIIGLTIFISSQRAQHAVPLQLMIGIRPTDFTTVDYFPLIPWFGVILIGYGIGSIIIPLTRRHNMASLQVPDTVTWPGRHSLLVYLIHQPIILAILWMIMR